MAKIKKNMIEFDFLIYLFNLFKLKKITITIVRIIKIISRRLYYHRARNR